MSSQQPDARPGRKPPRPLDTASLQALALHYAARYATTTGKLRSYLARKLKERPWQDQTPPNPEALIEKLATLGYVDDEAWAGTKSRAMAARGLGRRRISGALAAAGVSLTPEQAEDAPPPEIAALTFARRRRLGPYGPPLTDPAAQRRALAAMLRAGHDFDIARRVLAARSEEEILE